MDRITGRVKQIAGPLQEYMGPGQAKEQLRLSNSLEDATLARLITASRTHTEKKIGRFIGEHTMQWKLPCFPSGSVIYLPYPPLTELVSITYVDADGATQTFYDPAASPAVDPGTFGIETDTEPGFLWLNPGETWPTDALFTGLPVTITFKCGLDLTDPEQDDLVQGMMMLLSHWFEHREAVVIGSIAQMNALAAALIPLGYQDTIQNYIWYEG